jgi:hypothetical protein
LDKRNKAKAMDKAKSEVKSGFNDRSGLYKISAAGF